MVRICITFFIGITLTIAGQSTLGNDLKACYSLNGNANDPIGSLNGSPGAVTSTSDRNNVPNTCYNFAGNINSIITLADDPRLKGQFMTVSAWACPTSGVGSYIIFAKNKFTSYHEAYCIGIDYYNSVFSGAKVNSTGVYYAKCNALITLNNWYHLVITVDTSSISLYVNGVLSASTPAPGPIEYESGKKFGSAEAPNRIFLLRLRAKSIM